MINETIMVNKRPFGITFFVYMAAIWFFALSCDEVKDKYADPEKAFLAAREYYDDENYEMSLPKLQEFKARFPYSKYAREADLLIGDAYYQTDSFAEAAAVYEQFVKLYPSHPKVDFAKHRVGLCYWAEAPEALDREQDFTRRALKEWEELERDFPKSKHLPEAKAFYKIGRRRLADADHFVAKFYCKLEKWGACAYRAVKIIDDHAQFKEIMKSAAKLGEKSLYELAQGVKSGEIKSDANLLVKTWNADQLLKKSQELGEIYKKF